MSDKSVGMDFERDARLRCAQASDQTGRLVREFWGVVPPKLPKSLDMFYPHAPTEPELAKLVSRNIDRLKSAQSTEPNWQKFKPRSTTPIESDHVKYDA